MHDVDETRNLFRGDYLYCRACGHSIFRVSIFATSISISEIRRSYYHHAKYCFGLKRLLITKRKEDVTNGKEAHKGHKKRKGLLGNRFQASSV